MSPFLIMASLFIALTFSISMVLSGIMVRVGVGDRPDHRSNHKRVTPTSGGLAIVATLGLMSLLIVFLPGWFRPSGLYAQILSLIFAVGFLGLMDDILDLSALFKFFLLVVISAAAVAAIGPVLELPFRGVLWSLPPWFAWGGSILWVFVVTNIVNFMDGSNGLMLSVMGIACFFLSCIAFAMGAREPFLLMVVLSAAIGGLAVYNFRRRALIFSGDVGSLTIGFVFAVAALWLIKEVEAGVPVYVAPVLILPFLVDGFYTMYVRALKRKKLIEPHQDHLYQRLIKSGMSHRAIAFWYAGATIIVGLYAVFIIRNGLYHNVWFPCAPAIVLSFIYVLVGRKVNLLD